MFGEFSPSRKIDFQNREANRQRSGLWQDGLVRPSKAGPWSSFGALRQSRYIRRAALSRFLTRAILPVHVVWIVRIGRRI
jgi:hypothetical protein